MSKKAQKRSPRKKALVIENGAVVMYAGIIIDDTTAVHIHHRTAEALGVHCGDFLELRHPERDTLIVRRLCCCAGPGMRENYAYLDRQSFDYLDGQLHDEILVKEAEWPMEMP